MAAVLDRTRWPVVTVSVEAPGDLDKLADELDALLAEEQPFALTVVAPGNLDALQEMLWQAPSARLRLRRQRARLAAWCEAAVHVLDEQSFARTSPFKMRYAELIWGCEALAADCEEKASERLLSMLAERPGALAIETV